MNKERTRRRILPILIALLIAIGCYAGVMVIYKMTNSDTVQDKNRILAEQHKDFEEEEEQNLEEEETMPSSENILLQAEDGKNLGNRRGNAGNTLPVSRGGTDGADGISGGEGDGIPVPAPAPETPVTPEVPAQNNNVRENDKPEKPEEPEAPIGQNIINVEKSGIVNVYGVHYAVLAFGDEAEATDSYSYYLSGKKTGYVTYIDLPKTGVKIELPDNKARTLEVRQGNESLAVIKLGAVGSSTAATKSVYDGNLEIAKIAPDTIIGDRLMYIYTSYIAKVTDEKGNIKTTPISVYPKTATIAKNRYIGVLAASGGGGGGGGDPTPDPGAKHTKYGYIAFAFDMIANYSIQKEYDTITNHGRSLLMDFDSMAKLYGLNADRDKRVPFRDLGKESFEAAGTRVSYRDLPKYVKWMESDGSLLTKINFETGKHDDFENGPDIEVDEELMVGADLNIHLSEENETWFYSLADSRVVSADGQGRNFDVTTRLLSGAEGSLTMNIPFYFKGFAEHPGEYELALTAKDYNSVVKAAFAVVNDPISFAVEWDYQGNLLLKHYSFGFAGAMRDEARLVAFNYDNRPLEKSEYTLPDPGFPGYGGAYSIKVDRRLFEIGEDHEISIKVRGYAAIRLTVSKEDEEKLKNPPVVTVGKTYLDDVTEFTFEISADTEDREWEGNLRSITLIFNYNDQRTNYDALRYADKEVDGKVVVRIPKEATLSTNTYDFIFKSKDYQPLTVAAKVIEKAPAMQGEWLASGNLKITEKEGENRFLPSIEKIYVDGKLIPDTDFEMIRLNRIIMSSKHFEAGKTHELRFVPKSWVSFGEGILTVKAPGNFEPAREAPVFESYIARLYKDIYLRPAQKNLDWEKKLVSVKVELDTFRTEDVTAEIRILEDGTIVLPHRSNYNSVKRFNVTIESKGYEEVYTHFEMVNADPLYTLEQTAAGDVRISFSSASSEVQYTLGSEMKELKLDGRRLAIGSDYMRDGNYTAQIYRKNFNADGEYTVTFIPRRETDSEFTPLKFGSFDVKFRMADGKLIVDKNPVPQLNVEWDPQTDSLWIKGDSADYMENLSSVRIDNNRKVRVSDYQLEEDGKSIELFRSNFANTGRQHIITLYAEGYEKYEVMVTTPDVFQPVIKDPEDYSSYEWQTDGSLLLTYISNAKKDYSKKITGILIDGEPVVRDLGYDLTGYKLETDYIEPNKLIIGPRNWKEHKYYEITIQAEGYRDQVYRFLPEKEYIGLKQPPKFKQEMAYSGEGPVIVLKAKDGWIDPLWLKSIYILDIKSLTGEKSVLEHAWHNTDTSVPGQLTINLEDRYAAGEVELEIIAPGYEFARMKIRIDKKAPEFESIWADNSVLKIIQDGSNDNATYFGASDMEGIQINGDWLDPGKYTVEAGKIATFARDLFEGRAGESLTFTFAMRENKFIESGSFTVEVPGDIGTAAAAPEMETLSLNNWGEPLPIRYDGGDPTEALAWQQKIYRVLMVQGGNVYDVTDGLVLNADGSIAIGIKDGPLVNITANYVFTIYAKGYEDVSLTTKFRYKKAEVYVTKEADGSATIIVPRTETARLGSLTRLTANGHVVAATDFAKTSDYEIQLKKSFFDNDDYKEADGSYRLSVEMPATGSYPSLEVSFDAEAKKAPVIAEVEAPIEGFNKKGDKIIIQLAADDQAWKEGIRLVEINPGYGSVWNRITEFDIGEPGKLVLTLDADRAFQNWKIRILSDEYEAFRNDQVRLIKRGPGLASQWPNLEKLVITHDGANGNINYFRDVESISLDETLLTVMNDYTIASDGKSITVSNLSTFNGGTTQQLLLKTKASSFVESVGLTLEVPEGLGESKPAPVISFVGEVVLHEKVALQYTGDDFEDWLDGITEFIIIENKGTSVVPWDYDGVYVVDEAKKQIVLPRHREYVKSYTYTLKITSKGYKDVSVVIPFRYAKPEVTATAQYNGDILLEVKSGTTRLDNVEGFIVNGKELEKTSSLVKLERSKVTLDSAIFKSDSEYFSSGAQYSVEVRFGSSSDYPSFDIYFEHGEPAELKTPPVLAQEKAYNNAGDVLILNLNEENTDWKNQVKKIELQSVSLSWNEVKDYDVSEEGRLIITLPSGYSSMNRTYGLRVVAMGYETIETQVRFIRRPPNVSDISWPSLEELKLEQDGANGNSAYFNNVDKIFVGEVELAKGTYTVENSGKILRIGKAFFTAGEQATIRMIPVESAYTDELVLTVDVPENLGQAETPPEVTGPVEYVIQEDILLTLRDAGDADALVAWVAAIDRVMLIRSSTEALFNSAGEPFVHEDGKLVLPWMGRGSVSYLYTYTLRIEAEGYKDMTIPNVQFRNAKPQITVSEVGDNVVIDAAGSTAFTSGTITINGQAVTGADGTIAARKITIAKEKFQPGGTYYDSLGGYVLRVQFGSTSSYASFEYLFSVALGTTGLTDMLLQESEEVEALLPEPEGEEPPSQKPEITVPPAIVPEEEEEGPDAKEEPETEASDEEAAAAASGEGAMAEEPTDAGD